MKTKNSLARLVKEEQRNKNKEFNHSGGVTNKLLEKYMHSRVPLTVIRGGKVEINGNEAA